MEELFDRNSRVLIVSPHPDDEVIGAGAQLPRLSNATILQVTDGAPSDMTDARAAGLNSREEYAAARLREVRSALALAGEFELLELEIPDQTASLRMVELTERIREIIRAIRPDAVMTVPYEGGHPDHDATALAVQLACLSLDEWERPRRIEMLSYHERDGKCEMDAFLDEDEDVVICRLTDVERELKRRLFDCFKTQQQVLRWFPIALEKFRPAPIYDFRLLPHRGQLYYERFAWGMSGQRWRELAQQFCHEELTAYAT